MRLSVIDRGPSATGRYGFVNGGRAGGIDRLWRSGDA